MKRITIALASLGFCAATFAALPAASSPSEIIVPQLPGGFTVGGTLLYLQPSINNGDLDYASNSQIIFGSPGFATSQIERVEPGYGFGWGANVGYEFAQTGNDINLSYQHLKNTSEDSAYSTQNFLAPTHIIFVPMQFNPEFQFASAKANVEWNRVDLTAGQMINIGSRLNVHPSAGVSYVDIKRTLNSSFYKIAPQLAQPTTSNAIQTNSDHSHYWGVGPIAGLDASFYLGEGLGLVTHLQGGVLAGDITDNTNANFQITNSTFIPASLQFNTGTNFRLVPTYTAKAGADFTYHFDNSFASYLTAEAGYQVNEYFNAVDSTTATFANSSIANTVIATGVASRTSANLFLDGPYANITLHM
jgi:opacity protein-like surface antigen